MIAQLSVIELAVKGILPKLRIGRKRWAKKAARYAETTNRHDAPKSQPLEVKPSEDDDRR